MSVQTSLRGYSEKDVSSLLGLPVRQIRSYARDGLLSEGGGMLSFEDVVLLRAVKKLVDSDVAPRRVRPVSNPLPPAPMVLDWRLTQLAVSNQTGRPWAAEENLLRYALGATPRLRAKASRSPSGVA